MKCAQTVCTQEAVNTVYWPGKVPPPVYCEDCTVKAVQILGVMGVGVAVIPLPIEEEFPEHESIGDA
jgi:hypothetical protein